MVPLDEGVGLMLGLGDDVAARTRRRVRPSGVGDGAAASCETWVWFLDSAAVGSGKLCGALGYSVFARAER